MSNMVDVSTLTEKDKQGIEELRSRLNNELQEVPSYSDDYSLLRWLTAYDYDIDAILPKIKYLLSTISALKLNEADFSSIEKVTDYVNAMTKVSKYCPGGILGYDGEGNVVMMQPMAKCDPQSLMASSRMSDMMIIGIAEGEGVMNLIRANEKRLNRRLGVVLIIDMEGFNRDLIWMPGMKCYMHLLQLLQDLFPGAVRKLLVIRAPTGFQVAYNMVYPVLTKESREMIEFVGDDWKEKLQEIISPDQIFEYWGGTKEAPTPFGHIRMGGKVPKELQWKDDEEDNSEVPAAEKLSTLSVSAHGTRKVVAKVDRAGSRLKWFFRVSSGDIDFSIVHSSGKVLRPAFRLNTDFVPEYGQLHCDLPGENTFIFDNSYSILRSKEIKYRIQVIEPSTD